MIKPSEIYETGQLVLEDIQETQIYGEWKAEISDTIRKSSFFEVAGDFLHHHHMVNKNDSDFSAKDVDFGTMYSDFSEIGESMFNDLEKFKAGELHSVPPSAVELTRAGTKYLSGTNI